MHVKSDCIAIIIYRISKINFDLLLLDKRNGGKHNTRIRIDSQRNFPNDLTKNQKTCLNSNSGKKYIYIHRAFNQYFQIYQMSLIDIPDNKHQKVDKQ